MYGVLLLIVLQFKKFKEGMLFSYLDFAENFTDATGSFTAADIEIIKRYPLVTIEKWQGLWSTNFVKSIRSTMWFMSIKYTFSKADAAYFIIDFMGEAHVKMGSF